MLINYFVLNEGTRHVRCPLPSLSFTVCLSFYILYLPLKSSRKHRLDRHQASLLIYRTFPFQCILYRQKWSSSSTRWRWVWSKGWIESNFQKFLQYLDRYLWRELWNWLFTLHLKSGLVRMKRHFLTIDIISPKGCFNQ